MTEPGPPRPGARPDGTVPGEQPAAGGNTRPDDPFADLAERPTAEHVAVFDTEHARLERQLGTIDQL